MVENMNNWKFENFKFYVKIRYEEKFNQYLVSLRTLTHWEVDSKIYKRKADVNRFLKNWGFEERI